MANTTNFNWETPDDTDLVKDGAAAIRTLGSAIDTSLVDLKGGTTGQILSKATNTDMDFTWISNDVGDITAVSAGTGLSGGGTSGAVSLAIDTATTVDVSTAQTLTNKTLTSPVLTTPSISTIDAKGDLLVGSADNTIARLAVGTNDYVLTADSSATNGVKWAAAASGGGWTLLETKTFDNTVSTYTFSSIAGTYTHLVIIGESMQSAISGMSDTDYWNVRFNGNTDSDYVFSRIRNVNTTLAGACDINATSFVNAGGILSDTNDNTAGRGGVNIFIPNYAGTTNYKYFYSQAIGALDGAEAGIRFYNTTGQWLQTSAITSITFVSDYTANAKAGTLKLYGVK